MDKGRAAFRIGIALAHQPQEIAVSGNVIEPVVVHTDVRDVRRHAVNRSAPANLKKSLAATKNSRTGST